MKSEANSAHGLTIDSGDIRCQYRSDEDITPDEVLLVNSEKFLLIWELKEERTDWRSTEP